MSRRAPRRPQPSLPQRQAQTPVAGPRSTSIRDAGLAFALLLSLLVVYGPSLHGTLLWDDAAHITRPDLQSLSGLWRIWFDVGATQQYYPLLHSAFWIEHRVWGDNVLGYHLINLVWHWGSALCLVVIARQLDIRGGWLAAWLFALHPVQVESVAWMTEQKNTLSLVCALAAAVAYLRYGVTRRPRTYAIATLLFGCALLSKTTAATVPAGLLVILWWKRGRVDGHDARWLAPWLALGLLAGTFTAWVEHRYIGATGEAFTLNPLQHVLLAGRIVWFYATTLAWPTSLIFNYPRWNVDPAVWWQYLFPLAIVGIVGVAWRAREQSRGPLAVSLLFVGTLVPALGFVNVYPFVYAYVADHFQYQASIALIVPFAWWLSTLLRRGPRAAPIVVGGLVFALSGLTFRQSADYANVETLYRTTIARNPASWMSYENLGVLLAQAPGRLEEGIEALRAAVRIAPHRANGHRNLAIALTQAADWRAAAEQYQEVLAIDGRDPQDHVNLARALLASGERERAVAQARAAIQLDPNLAEAHLVMGRAWAPIEPSAAITEFRTVLALRPDSFEAAYNLGTLLLDVPGQTPAAVAALTTAVSLKPDDPRARTNLGIALQDADDIRGAIEQLEAAVRLAPDLEEPRSLLAHLTGRK